MPVFKYLGISKTQQKAIIDQAMIGLEDDFEPAPRWGGFPIPATNEVGYYPDEKDKPKTAKLKQEKRDAYRKKTLEEAKEKAKAVDAMVAFTVGRKAGRIKKNPGKRIEFPKGQPVAVKESNKQLITKLRTLCACDNPMFEEVVADEKPKAEPKPAKS